MEQDYWGVILLAAFGLGFGFGYAVRTMISLRNRRLAREFGVGLHEDQTKLLAALEFSGSSGHNGYGKRCVRF
jgi:hypothetical protein